MIDAQPAVSADFERFRQRAHHLTGIDLTCYKVPQMQRRLGALLARVRVDSFDDYARLLERDEQRQQEFRDFVTINVSGFFRDADRFSDFERAILPDLLAGGAGLRIWSAGCSIGAEPYSLAMLLQERAPAQRHRLLATDIDDAILARARAGADYTLADLREVAPARRQRWFVTQPDGRFAIHPAIRAAVTFQHHDLVREAPPRGPFDLVVCRNVVIYFTDRAKEQIYQGFARVLRPGGVLFIGGTESILHPHALGLTVIRPGFYRREPT